MVTKQEDFLSIFIGADNVFTGIGRQEGDSVLFRRKRKIPLFKKWQPIHSNIRKKLANYMELPLYDLNAGCVTDQMIRIYFMNFHDFKEFHYQLNPALLRELESLRNENTFFYHFCNDLQDLVDAAGQGQVLRAKFKEDFDFFHGMKSQNSYVSKADLKKK